MQSLVSLTGWRAHQWVSLFQFLHILPVKQYNGWISMKVWKDKLFYSKCLWISYFFQIFNFIGSSVIFLSRSEIPIWTHQRQFGLRGAGWELGIKTPASFSQHRRHNYLRLLSMQADRGGELCWEPPSGQVLLPADSPTRCRQCTPSFQKL